MRTWNLGLLCAAVALSAAIGVSALAQPPAAGAGGGGRQGRGGGQRGQGFGQTSVVTVPAAALAGPLKLTDDQKTKIAASQDKFTKDRTALMAPDANGQRPNFQEIGPKVQELTAATQKDIEAVLTEDQKKMLPAVLKDFQALQGAGIPAGVVGDLKLTADQKTKIAEIAKASQAEIAAKRQELQGGDRAAMQQALADLRKAQTDKIQAVLTDKQKTTLADYIKAHPQRGFGGGAGGNRRPGGNPPPPPAQ